MHVNSLPEKNLIKRRFLAALNTYEENAKAQKKIIKKLFEFYNIQTNKIQKRAMEIGCGTGLLTELLVEKTEFSSIFVNDIVHACFDVISKKISPTDSKRINLLPGDIETINFPSDLDLIISGSTFQWIKNHHLFFKNCHSSLRADGFLIFNTFDNKNLFEIKNITGIGLDYLKSEDILKISDQYFETVLIHTEEIKLMFDSPIDVLKHIKLTGVNSFETEIKTKNKIKEFSKKYIDQFSSNEKVSLTYTPVYYIMKSASSGRFSNKFKGNSQIS